MAKKASKTPAKGKMQSDMPQKGKMMAKQKGKMMPDMPMKGKGGGMMAMAGMGTSKKGRKGAK